jgi:hypothetical protein
MKALSLKKGKKKNQIQPLIFAITWPWVNTQLYHHLLRRNSKGKGGARGIPQQ